MNKRYRSLSDKKVVIDLQKGIVNIQSRRIPFSPMEFCYYRYFVERALTGSGPLRTEIGPSALDNFLDAIKRYHEESFSEMYEFRKRIDQISHSKEGLKLETFRTNVSRLNAKISKALSDPNKSKKFQIAMEGPRGARTYYLAQARQSIDIVAGTVRERFGKTVIVLSSDDRLTKALEIMRMSDFNQVVARMEGKLKLLTYNGISRWLAEKIEKPGYDLKSTKIREVLAYEDKKCFQLVDADYSVTEVRKFFSNRISNERIYLYAVIITEDGKPTQDPLGIITPWDFIDTRHW